MGAQQTKSDDEFLNSAENLEDNFQDYTKQNTNEREDTEMRLQQDEHNFFNPLEDTVTPDQYHTLLPMNEIGSHNLFSINSSRSTLTVADFAKIGPEPEQERNKSIDPYQCEIKRELLNEASNQELEKETYSNLEFNNSSLVTNNNVEIISEHQSEFSNDSKELYENLNQNPINDISRTEIGSTESNNIEKDNDLLIDNSYLDEIRDLLQNREVKEELLETHCVPLENLEIYQEDLGIDEPYIKKESNLSTEQGNKDPLNIEKIPKQVKNEILNAHDDENLIKILRESGSSIVLREKNLEIQSNLLTENINKDPNDDPSDGANVENLNTSALDTNKQSVDNNLCHNTLLNKDKIKDPHNVEQEQPKDIKIEIGELQINTNIEPTNKHLTQENYLNNHRFFKENSNDPLIIKHSSKEIKTKLVAIDFVGEKGTSKELPHKYDLVKNPFAYLKNLCQQKEIIQNPTDSTNNECNKEIISCAGVIIKSEIIIDSDGEEIEITGQFKTSIKSENDISITKEKSQTLCINDELIIKSEPLAEVFPIDSNLNSTAINNWNDVNIKGKRSEETSEKYQLPFIDINDDLNTSLNVNVDNLSTPDSNIDELFFTQSNDDILSNSTAITSPTSSEYHSIVEISSLDDIEFLIPKSNIKKNENKPQKKRRGRPIGSNHTKIKCHKGIRSGPKTKSRVNSEDSTNSKKEKLKKKVKKSTKYTEKDSAFHISSGLRKNIPKPTIVTRTKETTQIPSSPKPTKTTTEKSNKSTLIKKEFPKPFKLEMTTNTENEIARELPRPMVFKSESNSSINVRETQLYKTSEFQPSVRLKRLKSEELLVPYKVRKMSDRKSEYKEPNRFLRRSYPFVTKSTAQNMSQYSLPNLHQREFLIQNAYSLNPHVKLHRWSMDQDNPFHNNSHLTSTSFGMPSRTLNYRQSKYFTPQELHNLFQSPAHEEETSSHSGHFDSGVSSSTPIISSHTTAPTDKENKTLLLEIAAERAFINNHLLHFGFSPIHFELYNNVEDLNIFLKYLFGQLNNN